VPTYQYACTQCGHEFEAFQSFSDAALTECPACGGKLRKVYGSVGVVFKGSGFYRNDSRSNKTSTEPSKTSDKPVKETAGVASGETKSSAPAASSSSSSSGNGSTGSSSGSGSSSAGSKSGSGSGGSSAS
jgi:putative FmdB family regulatory protein